MREPVAREADQASRPEGGVLRALAWARVAVGIVFLLRSTPLVGVFDPALGADARPLLGWPETATQGFGLALASPVVEALCIVRTVAFAAFTLGLHARVSGLCAAISGYLVILHAPFAFTATQHLLLQATILLSLADSAAVVALRPNAPRSPLSSVWMMRAFVASVYAWAGVEKLRADWLDGRTLALFHEEAKLRGPLADVLLATPSRCAIAAPAIAVGELALAPLLLFPSTRVVGLCLAACFHLGIEWMGHPDVIGWVMLALLVVFVRLPAHRPQ